MSPTPSRGQRSPYSAHKTEAPAPQGFTFSSVFKAINDGVTQINEHVRRAEALQKATAQMELDLHAERLVIETAFSLAESAMKLEEYMRDSGFREIFEQNRTMFDVGNPADGDAARIDRPLPVFSRTDRHMDLEIEAAIQRKVDGLRNDREHFLSVMHANVASNATLCARFLKELHKLYGDHYLAALDPESLLCQR